MLELTLSQALARVDALHKAAASDIRYMSAAEWSTPRGHEMCNREKELYTALVVLLELAAEGAPQAAPVAASH